MIIITTTDAKQVTQQRQIGLLALREEVVNEYNTIFRCGCLCRSYSETRLLNYLVLNESHEIRKT